MSPSPLKLVGSADLETGQTFDAEGRPEKARIVQVVAHKEIVFSERRGDVSVLAKAIITTEPRPSFFTAMSLLLSTVVEEMELGDGWLSRGEVTELKLVYLSDNDREVSIERITARLRVDQRASQVVQTRRIGHDRISGALRDNVFKVVKEARAYIEGKTAQLSLLDKPEIEPEETDDEEK